MFATKEIRTSYEHALASWIVRNYEINDIEEQRKINNSLSLLSDEKLIEAGKEIEDFENDSINTMVRLDRKILTLEHSFEEEKERSEIPLPLFS